MAPCKAGAKGQEFTMDAEGVITSAASPSLALGATGASLNHFVLTAKSGASLKFLVTPNGNLGVKGGCAQAGACGSGNMTCLDSHCGTSSCGNDTPCHGFDFQPIIFSQSKATVLHYELTRLN